MHLDLVDRGHDRGAREQPLEVGGHDVADADRTDAAVGEQLFERPVGVDDGVEGGRHRLVQDEQVELVDAELAGALVERVQGLVVAVVADPDLGLDEDVGAVDPGRAEALADLALVAVRGGRVDVPVASRQRGFDGLRGHLGGGLEHAETEGRHHDAVVQGEVHGHVSMLG